MKWQWLLLCWCLHLIGCADGEVLGRASDDVSSAVSCTVSEIRYPTDDMSLEPLYNGRGFLSDGNHLGHDLRLAEGTPIHPIACGMLRIYRAASGYGSLVAVVEHRLPGAIEVVNGVGRRMLITSFLSIYGHIRPSSLAGGRGQQLSYTAGMIVRPSDTIGFIENEASNGDGTEHLHLGFRLQTAAEAQRVDPSAWFRGYDGTPSRALYYADPHQMMIRLIANVFGGGIASATDDANRMDATAAPDRCIFGSVQGADEYCLRTYCPSRGQVADYLVCNRLGNWDCMCRSTTVAPPLSDAAAPRVCDLGSSNPPDDYCRNVYCPSHGQVADQLVCNLLGNWDCVCRASASTDAGASVPSPPDASPSISGSGYRYEFRVSTSSGYGASEPYCLRDQGWSPQLCRNTGSTTLAVTSDGWHRCELATALSPFIGSFYSTAHPDWGDHGQLGTVGNAPERCTATSGVDWRITDLTTGRIVFEGPTSRLACVSVGSQDRHALP